MPASMRIACAASIAVLMSFAAPRGAHAADPAHGEALAKRWCAACHLVAPDQPRAQADAPSFAAISATRRVPEIAHFLTQSHPQMPDMNLSRDEIMDLIAYMHTLAPPMEPGPPPPVKDDYVPPARG